MGSTIRFKQDMAALTTVPNVLAGNRFEFLPRTSHVAIYAIVHDDGAQTNALIFDGDVNITVSFGNVLLADAVDVQAAGALNRSDHLVASGIATGGDRLIISATNIDAVAADMVLMLEITDL